MALQQQSSGLEGTVRGSARGKQSSGLMWRLLVFSIVVFSVTIASWIGLEFGYQSVIRSQIDDVEKEARDLIKGVSAQEQGVIIDFYSRLANIKSLLGGHIYMSEFLGLVERTIDKEVYLTDLSVGAESGDVRIEGVAISYADLAQQMENFRKLEGVRGLELVSAARGLNGRVLFTLNLEVNSSLLSKNST